MFLYDVVNDYKQFEIEAYQLGIDITDAKNDFGFVGTKAEFPVKPASVRFVYKILKPLMNSDFKSELLEFIQAKPFKKYFVNSNVLSKKEILTQVYDIKKSQKFHFDANINSFVVSKQGFFKGKIAVLGVIRFDRKFYFCELVDADNVSRLEMFDYKKPYRKQRQGMMPPKLALFMLNCLHDAKVIFDPFCGTGTTLMLCNLIGKSFKGSDILQENIDGSIENLNYIQAKLNLQKLQLDIFESDANKLTLNDLKGVNAICSEGFLGKPKAGNESIPELVKESNELADFYIKFLENLADKVPSGFPICMTFPVFKSKDKLVFMHKLFDELESIGFHKEKLHPKYADYLYSRDDQRVLRQVVRILKN